MTSEPVSRKRPVAISLQEFRDEEIVEFFANKNRSFRSGSPMSDEKPRSRLVGAPHFSRDRKPTAAFNASSGARADKFPAEENISGSTAGRESSEGNGILFEDGPVIRVSPGLGREKSCKKTAEPAFGKTPRPIGSLFGGRPTNPGKPPKAAGIVCDPLDGKIRKPRCQQFERHPLDVPPPSKTVRSATDIFDGNEPADDSLEKESDAIHEESSVISTEENSTVVAEQIQSTVESSILSRLAETDEQLRQLIESWPRLSARLKETIAALVEVSS